MYFYKYQSPTNLAFGMLRNSEIFFASRTELNDPNEYRPQYVLNGNEEMWVRLVHFILVDVMISEADRMRWSDSERKSFLDMSTRVGKSISSEVRNRNVRLNEFRKLLKKTIQPILESVFQDNQSRHLLQVLDSFVSKRIVEFAQEHLYIASFSTNATNPTMWGHYARAEQGFVAVYKSLDQSISVESPTELFWDTRPTEVEGIQAIGMYKDCVIPLQSVKYRKRPPIVNLFRRLIHKFHVSEMEDHYDAPAILEGLAHKKQEEMVGLIKYSDWRYENEVRAILPTYGTILEPDARVVKIEPDLLKGIVFGPAMSDVDKRRAVVSCYLMKRKFYDNTENETIRQNDSFAFFQAQKNSDGFGFRIVPAGILDSCYSDPLLPIRFINRVSEDTARNVQEMAAAISNVEDLS